MDFMDYVEMDHANHRHNDAYLDGFENPHGYRGSATWTKEEMVAWNRQRCLDAMPITEEYDYE